MKKLTILLILIFITSGILIGTANPSGTNIIITEVLYDAPNSDTTEEWVELFNPSPSAININGWTLSDNVGTNTLPDFTIPSGGYFVFAKDAVAFQALYGFAPDADTMTLALGNTGDQLTLADSTTTEVDFVAWENYVADWPVSAIDKSIQRISDSSSMPIDTDTGSDWENSGTTGTPGSGYGTGDITAPVVTFTNPTDGSVVSGTVSVTCDATDDNGISSYTIKIDGSVVSNTNSYTWDTTTETDGSHTLTCEATDPSDNVGTDQISVTVDNAPESDLFEVYFTDPLAGVPQMTSSLQEGNISTGLVALIDSANSSINAGIYHLTWQPVIDALLAAHSRGVVVQIAADANNIDEFQSLIDAGIAVTGVATSYIMHNKFFIVDALYVWTGSYNPTETGTLFNANDGIKVRSATLATGYKAEFDQLFANISGKSKVDDNEEIYSVGAYTVEAYFAPKDTGLTRMIELIDGATSSIYISIFYITENTIYDALVRAMQRGVAVTGVFDQRGWRNYYSEADDLIALGLGVVDANPGVYHHKFMVIDGAIVITGSTNFSAAGFGDNDENSLVIHSTVVAASYIARTMEYYQDAVDYDNDPTAVPRIITKHYSGYSGQNFVAWRPHMSGNLPIDNIKQYNVWRWDETSQAFSLIQEVNWAVSYYSDADVVIDTTYYYCITAELWDGAQTGCSAEFAEVQNADGSYYQPAVYPATGHLDTYGNDLTAPVITINNPVDLATVSGFVDISFTVDDMSLIDSWEIYIDGVLTDTDNLFLWDSSSVSDGTHTIEARATDIFSNTGTANISVTVDNSAYVAPLLDYANMKFMTYNIEASGSNPDYIEVLKEENADIVILVETGDFDNNGNASANALTVTMNNYFDNTEIPYQMSLIYGQNNMYTGVTILSRYDLVSTTLIPLVTLDDGNLYDISHDFMDVLLNIGTEQVHIIGAHLKASSGASNELKREKAQEGIINYMDNLGSTANIIYAGDLNSFSPEDTGDLAPNGDLGYGPMSIMLKNDTWGNYSVYGSAVFTYTDAFRTLNPSDPGYTYYTSPYESRIDFVVVNNNLDTLMISSTVGDTASASLGSDHYSVDVTFDMSAWAPSDTTPPAQVVGLVSTFVITDQIDISWTANTEPDLSYYNIYRDGVLLTTVNTNSYSDTGLSASTTYTYSVSAVDTTGNEGLQSNDLIVTTDDPVVTGKILISEVYYDAVGVDADEEWIELQNTGTTDMDISGWTLSDNVGTFTLPAGSIITAGGYFVIARDEAGFQALYGFIPDVSGLTLALGNKGDQVILKDGSGAEIDFVAWENYVAGWTITASTGTSIARSSTTDTDTVDDWIVVDNNGLPGQ